MRLARIAAALLGAGLGLAPLLPIERADAQPRRGPGAATAPAGNDRREQVKKRIRAMRAYLLTEELSLDEQTAARLFPVLARYDDEIDRLLEKRIDVQRRLRRADALRDGRVIDRLIDEALANQRGFWDVEDRRIAELRKVLAPAQTAKLLVVLPALERKIQNQLRRAIAKGRPGAVEDDQDDDPQPDEAPAPRTRPRLRREAPREQPNAAPGSTQSCDPALGPCR
jgi:hypothetical protein